MGLNNNRNQYKVLFSFLSFLFKSGDNVPVATPTKNLLIERENTKWDSNKINIKAIIISPVVVKTLKK